MRAQELVGFCPLPIPFRIFLLQSPVPHPRGKKGMWPLRASLADKLCAGNPFICTLLAKHFTKTKGFKERENMIQ